MSNSYILNSCSLMIDTSVLYILLNLVPCEVSCTQYWDNDVVINSWSVSLSIGNLITDKAPSLSGHDLYEIWYNKI